MDIFDWGDVDYGSYNHPFPGGFDDEMTMPEVRVTGQRGTQDDLLWLHYFFEGVLPGEVLIPIQYGGGGGEATPPWQFPDPCQTENMVDDAAREIQDLIRQQPDWQSREYGAIIYRNTNGEIVTTELFRGMTVIEALLAGLLAPQAELGLPSDLAQGGILG